MDEQQTNQPITEVDAGAAWRQWEGQVIDGWFPLRRFLNGSGHSVLFVTEWQGKEAAIKMVPVQFASYANPRSRSLAHPNLLRILHFGTCQLDETDCSYVVMELAWESLLQILASRAISPEECAEILPSVLEGLAYVHQKGLVHGRVKPSNILKIGDRFKLAGDGLLEVGGTPLPETNSYDAPEVAADGVSAQGDVWSLGASVAEALSRQVASRELVGMKEVSLPESTTPALRDVVTHCLEIDPKARWTIPDIQFRLQTEIVTPEVEEATTPLPEEVAAVPLEEVSAPAELPVAPPAEEFAEDPAFSFATEPLENISERPPARRYVIPAILALVLLICIWALPRLLNRRPEGPPTPAEHNSKPAAPVLAPQETAPPSMQPRSSTVPQAMSPAANRTVASRANAQEDPVQDEVVQTVLPDLSPESQQALQGVVRVGVRVQVDAAGLVTSAKLDPSTSNKNLAAQAMQAAKQWRFAPAPTNAKRRWTLRFEFRRSGIKAIPVKLKS